MHISMVSVSLIKSPVEIEQLGMHGLEVMVSLDMALRGLANILLRSHLIIL